MYQNGNRYDGNIKEQCAQKGELGALWTTLNERVHLTC